MKVKMSTNPERKRDSRPRVEIRLDGPDARPWDPYQNLDLPYKVYLRTKIRGFKSNERLTLRYQLPAGAGFAHDADYWVVTTDDLGQRGTAKSPSPN